MHYRDDSDLPVVTDEQLEQSRATMKPYTLLILKAGPKFERDPHRTPWVTEVIWEHGKRYAALRLAGLMPIVCPVGDGGDVTGIGIFDATPEDVERIMAGDPGVRAGVFTYEIHPTRTFPGSSLPE